jgi:hypothetical protein
VVVVLVDRAGPAERVAGELLVDGRDHVAQRGVARGLLQRVDVVAVVGPRRGDQVVAGGGVGLVPHRQVGVDGAGRVGHGVHLLGGSDVVAVPTMTARRPRIDYLTGRWRAAPPSLASAR